MPLRSRAAPARAVEQALKPVVVITGATAGVGRATALEFARHGASIALLARDRQALEATEAELQALGCRTLTAPLDVSDAAAVYEAARLCEAELGPIDVWVNCAMATVFSPVAELSPEEVRRVTEVTYLGYVHGTMAALEHMRPRDRGVIVQVGSALAYRGIPLQAAYCGAKHAIRGFTDSLRTELIHARSGVQVTAVHLPAMNTPQFDWARTHRSKQPRPVAPVYDPAAAARAIVHAARHPAREYWLGGRSLLTIGANMIVPDLMDRILAAQAFEGQDRPDPVAPDRRDNLYEPVTGAHRVRGSFTAEARPRARAFSAPAARVAAAATAGLIAGATGAAVGWRLATRSERR